MFIDSGETGPKPTAPSLLHRGGIEKRAKKPAMFGILRPESPEQMPMSPETSPPPARSMAPMPSSQYSSREELLSHAKEWAAHQGYAIVIARSRFNRLWLKCDRGGQYENRRMLTPDQRKRKRGDSRLLGCPFKMLAIVRKDGVWKVQTEVPEHNHGPSEDLSMHPTLRRLTEGQTQKVNEMTDAGNSPAETLEELKKLWPDIKVLTRDIYNARKKYKTQKEMADMAAGLPDQHQAFPDPNETFPGPTPHGRWEWVPDGEEVTNKNKKRRRRPPVEQQNLDPQLQTPTSSRPPQFPPASEPLSTPENNYMRQLQDSQLLPPGTSYERPDQSFPTDSPDDDSFIGSSQPGPPNLTTTPSRLRSTQFKPAPATRHAAVPAPPPPMPAVETAVMTPSVAIVRSMDGGGGGNRPPPPPPMDNSIRNIDNGILRPIETGNQNLATTTTTVGGVGAAAAPKAQSGQVIMSRIERMEKEQRDQKNMLVQILGAVKGMQGR